MPMDDEDDDFTLMIKAFRPVAPDAKPDPEASETLQERIRKAGLRRDESFGDVEAYQTNEGTVVLGSPQDAARAALMRQSAGRVRRGAYKKVAAPRAVVLDAELDIDWGEHRVVALQEEAAERVAKARAELAAAEAAAAAVTDTAEET